MRLRRSWVRPQPCEGKLSREVKELELPLRVEGRGFAESLSGRSLCPGAVPHLLEAWCREPP